MRISRAKIGISMARLKINQQVLAERSGISRQTMSYVMNGRSCRPEVAGRIAEALSVDVKEILED